MHKQGIYRKFISNFLRKILLEMAISSKLISFPLIIARKMKLFFPSLFGECEQIVRYLWVFSHLPKRHLNEIIFFTPIMLFEIKLERIILPRKSSMHTRLSTSIKLKS